MIGGGEMGRRVRDTDWSATPLGAYAAWPQSLRSSLSLVLNAKGIAALYWGPEQWLLYNDAYGSALGDRHPEAFGRPMPEVLTDVAPVLGPRVAEVLRTGEGFAIENLPLTLRRDGRDEETVWTHSFSPVQGEAGGFAGVLLLATETTRQKQVERSEARARVRLETALRVARLGTFDWEPDTGAIEVDARGREMFGLPAEGALTQVDTFGRIAREDVDRVHRGAAEVMGIERPFDPGNLGRTIDFDYDVLHVDGSRRSIVSSGTIIVDPDGTRRMIGAFDDVTELKRAQARARAQNASLERSVQERTQDRNLIWQVSRELLAVADDRGRLLRVNPAWTRVLGWDERDLVGRTSAWLEHPEDRAGRRDFAAELAGSGLDAAIENRLRCADGGYRTLAWTAVPLDGQFYCSGRDVTEERAQAAALGESAEALRLHRDIVQSDESPILAFDHAYRVIAFNEAHGRDFRRVMGRAQAIGDVLPDLFPAEQAAALRGLMDRALAGERFVVVQRFGDPDRELPTWEITYTPLHDADGRVAGAFHHARDISERVRAEAGLAAAEDALRQSQKMEAVGQLTGGVAHDFNNLLTVIRSSTDLLKRPNLAEERRARYVAAISDTVDRAAKLTGQLLAFARRQALKPEVFAACDSVRALSDMMGTLTGSRIAVALDLSEPPSYVDVDPSQFDTALVNLAVNARDAMDGEGRIAIAVRSVDAIPAARARPGVAGPYVAVSLSDTGSGIPADMVGRIFEPFFTTKEIGKGTGLGLSQVYGFARQSGGDIAVDSAVGRGTTFTLYLPRVPAPAAATAEARQAREAPVDGHGLRVLVVEDNADIGAFAVQSLGDLGYATVHAGDGAAALAALAGDPDGFDVVFSDVMMPGMSGIELGQEIRRLHRGLPVVLTSGYSQVLAEHGTHGFALLHKPYSIEQLSQVLRQSAAGAGAVGNGAAGERRGQPTGRTEPR